MVDVFDSTKLTNQLIASCSFLTNNRSHLYPIALTLENLVTEKMLDNTGKHFERYDAFLTSAKTQSSMAKGYWKAAQAIAHTPFNTLATQLTEAYTKHFFRESPDSNTLVVTPIPGVDPDYAFNSPKLRTNWLLASFSAFFLEGQRAGIEHFNFGFFGTATFTNGRTSLGSSLLSVFRVHSGALAYKNIDAPLRSGTEYEIDYFVIDDYNAGTIRIYSDGSRGVNTPFFASGTVVLKSNISGVLSVAYSTRTSDILAQTTAANTADSWVNAYPIYFKSYVSTEQYSEAHTDSFAATYGMYNLAYLVTNQSKFLNARQFVKYNHLAAQVTKAFSSTFYAISENTDPLSFPGSFVNVITVLSNGVSRPAPTFTLERDLSTIFTYRACKITFTDDVPSVTAGRSLRELIFGNDFARTGYNQGLLLYFLALTIQDCVLAITLDIATFDNPADEYIFYHASYGTYGYPTEPTLTYASLDSFIKYKDAAWTAFGNNPSATTTNYGVFYYNRATVFNNRFMANGIYSSSSFNSTSECILNNVIPQTKVPSFQYRLVGNLQVVFTDDLGATIAFSLFDTANTVQTFSGTWGALTGARRIVGIRFKKLTAIEVTLTINSIGGTIETLPSTGVIRKAYIKSDYYLAQTYWFDAFGVTYNTLEADRKYLNAPKYSTINYTKASVDTSYEQLYVSGQGINLYSTFGIPFSNMKASTLDFLVDAQKAYENLARVSESKYTGFMVPVYKPFSLENSPETNTFSWKGRDRDNFSIRHTSEAMLELAKFLYNNRGESKARVVLEAYINCIWTYYNDNPTKVITTLKADGSDPTMDFIDPGLAALEAHTAMFCNIVGISTSKTLKLIQTRLLFIDDQYQNTGIMSGSWTKSQALIGNNLTNHADYRALPHAEIVDLYADLLLFRTQLLSDTLFAAYTFPYLTDFIAGNLTQNNFADFIDSIEEPTYPRVEITFAAGNKQVVLLNSHALGKLVTMRFINLESDKTNELISFYNNVSQSNGRFNFDTFQISYMDLTGLWVFEAAPDITTVISNSTNGIFNVTIKIKQVSLV